MYEKLVKSLRTCSYGTSEDCKLCSFYDEEDFATCDDKLKVTAADAIEELQASVAGFEANTDVAFVEENGNKYIRFIPKWIPVTERLPGREWVLCKCRAKIHEVLSLRDGYWYHDPQHQYMSGFVTHWMPLPTPPKEGEG